MTGIKLIIALGRFAGESPVIEAARGQAASHAFEQRHATKRGEKGARPLVGTLSA